MLIYDHENINVDKTKEKVKEFLKTKYSKMNIDDIIKVIPRQNNKLIG